jgi:hypothetical protein
MKIQNLNHIEVANQEVLGGSKKKKPHGIAEAYADAYAKAYGTLTLSGTYTKAIAVAGVYAKSVSSSYASAAS